MTEFIQPITNLIIIPIILGIIISNILKKKDKILNTAILVFISNIIFNISYYVYTKEIIIFSSSNSVLFEIFYVITIAVLMLGIEWIMHQFKTNIMYIYKKSTFILGAITVVIYIYFGWLVGSNGRIKFNNFMYNLVTPINTEAADFNLIIIKLCIYALFMLVCLF
ncbi:MAG: hypothetical protein RSD85_02660, partial [Erysipelotrichaceae bacterium]